MTGVQTCALPISQPAAGGEPGPSGVANASPASDAPVGAEPRSEPRSEPRAEGLTLAQKVSRIKEEIGLDPKLTIAKAVAEANENMGLEASGTMLSQVERLLTELGMSDTSM